MPSSLISAEDVPTIVNDGVSFVIKVNYQTTTGGTMTLEVDSGFTVVPQTYDLTTASPGSATFPVTITRGTATNAGTDIDFTFGNVISKLVQKVQP